MMYSIFLGFLTLLYCILMLRYIHGWSKLSGKASISSNLPGTRVSVILPTRNEEDVIEICLSHLARQDYPNNLYEVLVIDDNSSDSTLQQANSFIHSKSNLNYRTLALKEANRLTNNKKEAISFGVSQASGELIVTTDADCAMGTSWLSTIVAYYEDHKPKMISSPVTFRDKFSIAANIQSLEFIGLVASGAAAITIGHPIMCNGANLAYERDAFNRVGGFTGDKSASGDDVFLMYKMAKTFPGSVHFLKNDQAIVSAPPEQTIKGFLNQRMRWVSKTKLVKDAQSFFVAIIVYSTNLLLAVGTILLVTLPDFNVMLFILTFSAKFIVDFIFLYKATKFFKKRYLMWFFLPCEILNVFYVSMIGLLGSLKQYSWKN